jgi:hypothetical protein
MSNPIFFQNDFSNIFHEINVSIMCLKQHFSSSPPPLAVAGRSGAKTRVNNLSSISQVTSLNFLFNYTYVTYHLSSSSTHSHHNQLPAEWIKNRCISTKWFVYKDFNINSSDVLMMLSELWPIDHEWFFKTNISGNTICMQYNQRM